MHRILSASLFLLLFLVLIISHSSAVAYTIDGDVSDWGTITWGDLNNVTLDSSSADKVTGDGTLGPGVGGQGYDVEAMFFDSDPTYGYFALITGFPLEGRDWGTGTSAIHFGPGDVAIDVSTATSGDGSIYEFGIDLPDASGPSNLIAVNDWENVYYSGHSAADPWKIVEDTNGNPAGIDIGDAMFAYGNPGNGHYIYEFSFLLGDLGLKLGDAVTFQWTMECGNNYLNLPATVNHAPEPASMLLLGTGLLGIAATSRKKFKK